VATRILIAAIALLALAGVGGPAPGIDETRLPATYMPSGAQMYADAKGRGPAASTLTTPPPDLTTLAKRHFGKFPYDYVTSVVEFGPGVTAHGSSGMPTWGPIFRYYDKQNERVVKERIKRLCDYLATMQGR
jgi:hypothetical protein